MLELPSRTEISKNIYKKDLLLRFNGTTSQKQHFNSEIESIKVVNELSERSLGLPLGKDINNIFVILVEVKKQEISKSTIETIFDLINQKIVVVFKYDEFIKLGIKQTKIFLSEWKNSSYVLNIRGLDFDEVWQNFVEDIANFTVEDGQTLTTAVTNVINNEQIDKEIEKLTKKMRNTKTPSKRFEIYNKILELKKRKG